jgi:FtsZ-binding cell division protein ZapB
VIGRPAARRAPGDDRSAQRAFHISEGATLKKAKDSEQIPLQGSEEAEILGRLAERVERAVATIAELRKERDRLQSQVDELTSQMKDHSAESDRLSGVEEENSRYREERDVIRTRIESMLRNLETLDENEVE